MWKYLYNFSIIYKVKNMEKILVSACLLGDKCKYNGKDNYIKEIEELKLYYEIIPICPEMMGGLKCPRDPSEIYKNRVISIKNKDVTHQFNEGKRQVLNIVNYVHIRKALLKENSPSCGINFVYDGTFSNKLVSKSGVTAQALKELGLELYNENQIQDLINVKKKSN